MKKILLTTMLLCSLVSSACSSDNTSQSDIIEGTVVETEEASENETEVETLIDVEEQVIYDSDNIKVTVTGFGQDNYSVWLTVLAENNSDKDIILQTRKSSINEYMCDFIFSCDVAAGKKANDKIEFLNYDLDNCGIGKITDIEFVLCITDNSFTNNTYSDIIHVTRNLPEPDPQVYDDSGDVVFDDNSIKIVSKYMEIDSYGDASFWFYIENNSDDTVVIQTKGTSINGFMVDGIFSCEVLPGKHAVDDIRILGYDLEENSIDYDNIKELETSFRITKENLIDEIASSEPVIITYE